MKGLGLISCLGLVFTALLPSPILALSSVTLEWDEIPSADIAGYRLHYGAAPLTYTNMLSVGNLTRATVSGLVEGTTYFFVVTATDSSCVESRYSDEIAYKVPLPANRRASAIPPTLSLTANGSGSILPDLRHQVLVFGRTYTLRAIPDAGQLFAGWSGSITSASPTLQVILKTNIALQATFIPNPYLPLEGTYTGLFCEEDAVRLETAGAFSVSVTARGAYSGKVRIGARSLSFSGLLDPQGRGSNVLRLSPSKTLSLELRVGSTDPEGRIFGTLTDGSWQAALSGYRAVFGRGNPTPDAGNYTLIIPGTDDGPALPAGNGFGTLKVESSGRVSLTGTLADSTKFSQSGSLSRDGFWPLYVSLYSGNGSLVSWLAFANQPDSDLAGALTWIKRSSPKSKYYPSGFTNDYSVIGSAYVPKDPLLDLVTGSLTFSGGDLSSEIIKGITIGPLSKVTTSDNQLSFSFSRPTGSFSGTVSPPAATGKRLPFSGVVLQKLNAGYGMLLGTDQSGRVSLTP